MKINIKDSSLRLDLNRKIKYLPAQIDRALSATAQQGVNIILNRTEEGRGINGQFNPYSEKYARFRTQKGRQVFPVNLNFTGRMLSAMTNERVRSGVQRIKFSRAEESRKAYFNNRTRPFFGFSKNEKAALGKFFQRRLSL